MAEYPYDDDDDEPAHAVAEGSGDRTVEEMEEEVKRLSALIEKRKDQTEDEELRQRVLDSKSESEFWEATDEAEIRKARRAEQARHASERRPSDEQMANLLADLNPEEVPEEEFWRRATNAGLVRPE